MAASKWQGRPPQHCEFCGKALGKHFVDGQTVYGWALLDDDCHAKHGMGLGIGLGQRYERQDDGDWVKVAG